MGEYKKSCCKSYLKKKKACKKCPVIGPLPKKARKKAIRKLRRQHSGSL